MDIRTEIRTRLLDNTSDFDHSEVLTPCLDKLTKLCQNNLKKLNLISIGQAGPSSRKQKCTTSFITAPHIPNVPAPQTSKGSYDNHPNKKCLVCGYYVKGRRGLRLHLGRNPNCRRNSKLPENILKENDSIPRKVLEAVKGPSTSVESLENMCGDGLNTKIKKHNSKHGCTLCHRLVTKDHYISSSTHRVYESSIPTNVASLSCNSTNLVYLITCQKCKLQYTGETAQLLRERIRHHVSCFNHPEKDNTCRILSEHFGMGLCKNATFTVNIIHKLSGNGRNDNGTLDPAITHVRRKIETELMLKLRTVYPFGLNGRVGDEYMTDSDRCNISSKFPSLKRVKEHQKVRTKVKSSNEFVINNFFYIINESFRSNLKNTMNLIRVLLSSLKKSSCRILYDRISDYLLEKHDNYLYSRFFIAALDILAFKIGTPPDIKETKKTPPSNCCHISFNNKAIDFINIQRILRDKNVLSSLPIELRENTPTIVYKLNETNRSKIFNYKSFVQTFNVDAFIADHSTLPCDCHLSPFCDPDHGHIISGDLSTIPDLQLRKLVSKGPKYREPKPFSFEKAKDNIMLGIDSCIESWSRREGLSSKIFMVWRDRVLKEIDNRIAFLSNNNRKVRKKSSILQNTTSKNCLSDLQSKYVLVPIDKAANNVAFICKRFYAEVLLKELGILGTSTSTYTKIEDKTPDEIVTQHQSELKNQFNISVSKDMLTLPDIYWLPKLHKNPIKFRYIIASKHCTTKTLSKYVSSIFSLFMNQIEAYYNKSHYYSGIKSYWIVRNRDPIMDAVRRSYARNSAKCVSSFDFSTLYTKIPHDKLIDVLNEIIDFVFKGGTRSKIAIRYSGKATWVKSCSSKTTNFTKISIKNAVSYLIKNCYFKLGDKLFRQDIGIPMGSDPAPAFANLFLFYYESSWLKSIKKDDNILARKFGQVFRYIDDLVALNDGLAFERYHDQIYPPELELNKENENNHCTNFLDLNIGIENGVFITKLFDKRDSFGFNITRLPYRDSNIPCRMFYSSITAECLRICRATTTHDDAITSIKGFLTRMMKQGAELPKIKNSIRKMVNKHQIAHKYNVNTNTFINQIL